MSLTSSTNESTLIIVAPRHVERQLLFQEIMQLAEHRRLSGAVASARASHPVLIILQERALEESAESSDGVVEEPDF